MKEFSAIPSHQKTGSVPNKQNRQQAPPFFKALVQPKLTVNQPGDIYEQEADAMADKVMQMASTPGSDHPFFSPAYTSIQRKCAECEEEEKVSRKESGNGGLPQVTDLTSRTLHSPGQAIENNSREVMEQHFAYDFSDVRIHNDSDAARSSQQLNARAYTSGNHIVFGTGEYQPDTTKGRHLLAHELTHVVQQSGTENNRLQRATHSGEDWAGRFVFDDNACTMNYNQDWYFRFPDSMNAAQQSSYITAAENQVSSVWSHKHRLMPSGSTCPCSTGGVDVSAAVRPHNEARGGRHGYGVNVVTTPTTGLTTLPTRTMTLSDTHDTSVDMGGGITQQRIAHEFGHALNMNDEYTRWASVWGIPGSRDRASIMYHGDAVRPRHYQPFADMISNTVEGCVYSPQGMSSSSLVNPVARFGLTGGLTLDRAEFVLDLHVDRRLGNTDLLGLFTPRLGFEMQLNTASRNLMFGPTVGLSLNRFQHPVYLDVSTGVLYDPEDPERPASLNIPASVTAGFRGSGFTAGINYTGMIDVLGNSGYTHLLGVNLQFDLPGGGR